MTYLKNEGRTLFINPELNPEPSSFQQDLLVILLNDILIYKILFDLGKIITQHQIKQNNHKLFEQISAFICVHLRLISVSLSDRTRDIQFELFRSRVENDSVMDGILRSGI